ncbi:hypothetical protein LT679_09775 [Mucilaginibacter roseus]|uniref:VWA domain-containing protein n=1 Tax=Mucilaginibacter roseus TaxID=1528868 RepID=A0ABS8U5W0_9SPHI|nr:hypothetical protein [Mucilaginibacter roseus]MCD8740888.1 hypothetical protein [Mucilaginibacter roseus]
MLFLFSITWGDVSGWWAPVCVLAGLLYAWLLYRQPVNISKTHRYVLFTLRALAVAIIAFLLLSPLVQSVTYKPEKPLVLILQDNSGSVKQYAKSISSSLSQLKQQLGDDYDVQEFNFDSGLHSGLAAIYNGRQTDISSALKQLNDRFVNRNVGAVVLASDGIFNRGADPRYEARNFKANFYTVALGDTTHRRDLLISNVNYNKTAFLGNDFEVEILASAYQSNGEIMRLTITDDGRQVYNQAVQVKGNAFRQMVPVKLNANKKGLHKFSVNLAPLSNEVTTVNNSETFYIDVLDARQKILLVYQNVHPDIAVIKNAIEVNRNYEVKTVLLTDLAAVKPADYNLLILFQLPASAQGIQRFVSNANLPIWYTVGAQTDVTALNASQQVVNISTDRSEMQEVFAQPADNFSAFTLSDSTRQKITRMPPLLAPFGNYGNKAAAGILFKQRIGNVTTSYPLLAFAAQGNRRTAVLTGEGLWRWKLAEYATFENNNALNELMSQSVQYLTANADRQQFRAYPAKAVFDEGEDVLINAELYNDALELINTPDARISIKDVRGRNLSFLFSRIGQSYGLNAGALPPTEYSYTATAKVGNRIFTASGKFTVKRVDIEARQTVANHQLLSDLARQSGAEMLQPADLGKLPDLIKKNESVKTVVYEDKHYNELVDVKWVFGVILFLISAEWFIRKREGEV